MTQDTARSKKVQAALSLGSAAAGLSALATKGGAVGARRVLASAPKAAKTLRLRPTTPERMDRTSLGLVTIGSGIGGASGVHFAMQENREAKKEARVSKSAFGVVHKEAGVEVKHEQKVFDHTKHKADPDDWKQFKGAVNPGQAKAKPRVALKAKGLNPEKRRQERMKAEQYGAAGGAAALGTVAAGTPVRNRINLRRAATASSKATANKEIAVYAGLEARKASQVMSRRLVAADRYRNDLLADNVLTPERRRQVGLKPAARQYKSDKIRQAMGERWKARQDRKFWQGVDTSASAKAAQQSQKAIKLSRVRKFPKKTAAAAAGLALISAGTAHVRRNQGRAYDDWWD